MLRAAPRVNGLPAPPVEEKSGIGARMNMRTQQDMGMARNYSDIEHELSQLPTHERAKLALALVESLEPQEEGDIAEAWRAEAERRLEQLQRGEIEAIPAAQAFANVRRHLG